MNADSLYPEADAEISDVLFEELFETDSEEVGSIHADNIYYDEKEDGDIGLESLALELSDNIEGKSPEEAYDYISEAWPALIPLITALAPAVIQAATTLAPMAVKAVGGLVGNLGKSKPVHQPPARPTPVRSAPIQTAPRTYVRPSQVSRSPSCTCAPIPPVQAQIPYQSGPQIPTQTPASAGIGGTLGKIGQGAL